MLRVQPRRGSTERQRGNSITYIDKSESRQAAKAEARAALICRRGIAGGVPTRAANALGLVIPLHLQVLATEIIE